MDAKTYRVKSMREALDLIRDELGPDASLLHCRRVRRRGVGGWLARKTELEVVASSSEDIPSRFPPEAEKWLARPESDVSSEESQNETSGDADVSHGSTLLSEESIPLSQARGMDSLRSHLRESGLDERLVSRVLEQMWQDRFDFANSNPSEAVRQAALKIAEVLPQGSELNCQVGMSHWVAMVGPRGSGKTTTLAKLASQFARERQMSVAIVKVKPALSDGGKVATESEVDQALSTYAELLRIPMVVVESPAEMIAQSNKLTEKYDLVLLDTPGWEPGAQTVCPRTREILEVAKPDEIQCVVSAGHDFMAELSLYAQFGALGPDGLILTHLDETPALHRLWPALQKIALPVNYLTHGCGVPDDLAIASVEQLVLWLQRSLHIGDDDAAYATAETGWAA